MDSQPPADKREFLDMVKTDRAELDTLIDRVGLERMDLPGAMGDWTPKDLVAHVTWSEREMVGVLRQRALLGSPLWNVSQTARNQAVYEEGREKPAADVLMESREVYQELLEGLSALDDEDLFDAGRFREMPADWPPWSVIASNTYEHYRAHSADLRAWLDSQPGADPIPRG